MLVRLEIKVLSFIILSPQGSSYCLQLNHVQLAQTSCGQSKLHPTPLLTTCLFLFVYYLYLSLYQARAHFFHLVNPESPQSQLLKSSKCQMMKAVKEEYCE